MSNLITADYSLGTVGNDLAGFVDTTGYTWALDTANNGTGISVKFATVSSATRAISTGAITSFFYYANTAIPSFSNLDIISEGYIIGTSSLNGIMGALWSQVPGTAGSHYVQCDFSPAGGGSGGNVARIFYDGANVQTVTASVSVGAILWNRINITGSAGSYTAQGYYSTTSNTGPWTTIGTSFALPSTFSGTGKGGLGGYQGVTTNNPDFAINKFLVNYTATASATATVNKKTLPVSVSGNTVIVTGTSTTWVNGTTTFSLSGAGATGSSVSTVINSTTQATLTITTGSTTGLITFTDSTNTTTSSLYVVIPPSNTALYHSPLNTYSDGSGTMQANNVLPTSTFIRWNNPGAYTKFQYSSCSSIQIYFDLSQFIGNSVVSNVYPKIKYYVDNGAPVIYQLTSSDTIYTIFSGASGTHTVMLYFMASEGYALDRWATPINAINIRGHIVNSGATPITPVGVVAVNTTVIGFDGDSITEGANVLATAPTTFNGANYVANEDSTTSWIIGVSAAFNAEYGTIAFGGEGLVNDQAVAPSGTGVVKIGSKFSLYSAGASRLVGGFITPAPTYWVVNIGTNDAANSQATVQTNLQTYLVAVRNATNATMPIFVVQPFGRQCAVAVYAAYQAVQATDSKLYFIDVTGTPGSVTPNYLGTGLAQYGTQSRFASDGLHPQSTSNILFGSAVAEAMKAALGATVLGGFQRTSNNNLSGI